MATYLNTQLLPIDDEGGFLLVHGVADAFGGEVYRDDTRLVSAVSGSLDDKARTDLLALLTEPRPASKAEAKQCRAMAKSHRELAESGQGGPMQGRYMLECAAKKEYSAKIAETDQLWLPVRVATARNGTAVACIVTAQDGQAGSLFDKIIVRHIDCRSGKIILEERLRGTKGGFVSPAAREYSQFLCLDRIAKTLLIETVEDKSTRRMPDVFFEERRLVKKLPTSSNTGPVNLSREGLVDEGDKVWVSCAVDLEERSALVSLFEQGTLKKLDEFKLSRKPVSMKVSDDGSLMVCGFLGGAIWIVELATQKIRKFAPHIGAGRDDWTSVQVATSNDFVVSECKNQFSLTWLEDGTSTTLGKPRPAVHKREPYKGTDTSVIVESTISVLGNRIAIVENAAVRELPASADDHEGRFVSEAGRKGARKPVRVTRKAPIDESIVKARLEPHKDALLALHSPAAVVRSKKLGKRGWSQPGVKHAPTLGASRFGGWPDLPDDSGWPRADGRPMAFLLQVNLAEAHAAQPDLRLPAEGLLSFFLGCNDETYSKDGDTRERFLVDIVQDRDMGAAPGWSVLFSPPSSNLRRVEYDDAPLPELFEPAMMRFQAGGKAFPDEQSIVSNTLGLTAVERADYTELIEQLQSPNHEHQLLGYPSIIQFTPPELFCEVGDFDFPPDDDSAEFRALAAKASEWTLLLQLFSDPTPDFLWGDGGHYYFYVRRKAMEKLDFSDTRVYFEN